VAFAASIDGMAILDADGRYLFVNPAHARLYGFGHPDELVGRSWKVLYRGDELERIEREILPEVLSRGTWRGEATGCRRDGSTFEQELSLAAFPEGGGLVCVVRDIGDRKRAERLEHALYAIAETAHQASHLDEVYRSLHRIVGSLVPARNFYIAIHEPETGLLSFPYFVDEHEPPPGPQPLGRGLTEYVLRTGRPLLVDQEVYERLIATQEVEAVGPAMIDWIGVPLAISGQTMGVLTVQSYQPETRFSVADLDLLTFVSRQIAAAISRRRADEQIRQLAFQDTLTRLPNRAVFLERLESALARRGAEGAPVALLFLDLDRFKSINDSFSHEIGDRLLAAVAVRLRDALRQSDLLARFGGDEFTVLLGDLNEPREAGQVADRLLAALHSPFDVDGREIFVGASVGIAVSPYDGGDAGTLLRNADAAMYGAKSDDRGTSRYYSPDMNARTLELLSLESRLRRSLQQDELRIVYQPMLSLADGRVKGLEALLRWDRDGEEILPSTFVPVAENSGQIVEIGAWAFERACRELARLRARHGADLRLCFNLSPHELRPPGFLRRIADTVAGAGLPPGSVELEITESVALDDSESTREVLNDLRALGLRISIDDFGTGFSSLAALRRLPIDTLKLDQSFVRHLPAGSRESAIARAVIDLSHALGFQVVAEGVETREQFDFLLACGCDLAQGFLLARPGTIESAGDLLAAESQDAAIDVP
jgi:diguanylate cyclase (GGDEF)-like protein/PAS domain S-box-containing protein